LKCNPFSIYCSLLIIKGTGNKTGIRYSNRSHFDYRWENGKIVEMGCYFDTTALNMELAAQ
jgi:ketosteroid isomerase-like protein